MSWCKTILAALLLLLWMPATSHCALESAGLLLHGLGCASGKSHCEGDGCKVIEEGLFKQTTVPAKAIPPAVLSCTCFICLQLVALPTLVAISDFAPRDFDVPKVWMTSWEFERRTALPSRAPSLV